MKVGNKEMISKNEFTLKYKFGKPGRMRIFGEQFVKNNKDNFKIIIDDKEYEMISVLNIIDIETGKASDEIIEVEERPFFSFLSNVKKKFEE